MFPLLKYNGVVIAKNIEYARSFLARMSGLMFRKAIPSDHAMIFILKEPSFVSVHMLFVFYDIDVIFLNKKKIVLDTSTLKSWTGYKSMNDIKYILEMKAGSIDLFNIEIGGLIEFDEN